MAALVNSIDPHVEIWKMKKMIQRLQQARGNGTSMISLLVPPNTQVSQINRLLTEEYGTATNIKSRVNRLSVLDAITSAQQRIKLYSRFPANGLVLFCGTIITDEGKEKKLTIDFEPFRPLHTSLYMCDNRFHCEALTSLLDDVDVFGFVVVTGDGCLIATLQGNDKTILHQMEVDLPKKHNKGGQSSVRFARLRQEARHNYLRKVGEYVNQLFLRDERCWLKAIVLAGFADFKDELRDSSFLDPRIKDKVIHTVDISYSGMPGLQQAIQLSGDVILQNRLIQEKTLLQSFFQHIAMDTGRYVFGSSDVIAALEQGAVETLLVNEQSPVTVSDQKSDERIPFAEWAVEHYRRFGAHLEFVSDASSEGSQFLKGFSGVGAILRWKLELPEISPPEETQEEDFAM